MLRTTISRTPPNPLPAAGAGEGPREAQGVDGGSTGGEPALFLPPEEACAIARAHKRRSAQKAQEENGSSVA